MILERNIGVSIHKVRRKYSTAFGLSQRLETIDENIVNLLMDFVQFGASHVEWRDNLQKVLYTKILSLNQIITNLYFQGLIDDFTIVKRLNHLKKLIHKSLWFADQQLAHPYLCTLLFARSALTLLRYRLKLIDYSYKGESVLGFLSLFKTISQPDASIYSTCWNQILINTQRSKFEIEDLYLLLVITNSNLQKETLQALDRISYLLEEIRIASMHVHKLHLLDCCKFLITEMEVIRRNICKA